MRRLLLPTFLLVARVAAAQDAGVRISPQFISYSLGSPSNNTISEMAIPLFAFMPVTKILTLDIGTAFASAQVTSTSGGQSVKSTISGLTDTQIRGTVNLGSDLVLLTAGVNVPTGRSTVTPAEQSAAGLIGNDFLMFPISSMGSGFGGTGGLAIAHPFGDWNLGAGFSVRHSMPFDPYQDAAGTKLRYTPGDETRARIGVDHPYGTGRASLGLTYSKFTDDKLVTSIYNTGDRLLAQGYVTSAMGRGDYVLSAWNLFRASGARSRLHDRQTRVGREHDSEYQWLSRAADDPHPLRSCRPERSEGEGSSFGTNLFASLRATTLLARSIYWDGHGPSRAVASPSSRAWYGRPQ
jgi:hypothetical protein